MPDAELDRLDPLDRLHHVAIPVADVARAVEWYTRHFRCEVRYQDETWALLGLANVELALVVPHQHPSHIAFTSAEASSFGPLTTHRDGTRSVYIRDADGNSVEILDAASVNG